MTNTNFAVTSGYADVPGGYIFYKTVGSVDSGRDVVLLNPGAADLRVWDSTVEWLSRIARVTMFDYRDSGLSSLATEKYDEIEDVRAVMDAAGVERAVLIGVSDGGRRLLAFAHRYPERVERAVPVSASFGPFPDPTEEEKAARVVMEKHFEHVIALRNPELGGVPAVGEADIAAWAPKLPEHERRRLVAMQVQAWYWVMLDEYLGVELDPPVARRLSEIRVPVSVLSGKHDFQGTQLWSKRLAREIEGATLTELDEGDHYTMLSAPKEFESFVRGLL